MKKLLLFLALVIGIASFAQDWQYIGGSGALGSASEIEIAQGSNGTLYAFYKDGSNGTVKKWTGEAWVLVGTAGFAASNIFDLQIEVLEDDYPVVAYKRSFSGERINVKYFNGSSWVDYGYSLGMLTEHDKEYDISVSPNDGIYLTYYNLESAIGNTNNLITASLGTGTISQYGGDIAWDDNDTYYDNVLGAYIDDSEDTWVAYGEFDVGSGGSYLKHKNGASYNSYTLFSGAQIDAIDIIDQGTKVGVAYESEGTSNLYYRTFNKSTSSFEGASLVTTSNLEFALTDKTSSSSYIFYKYGTFNYRVTEYNNESSPAIQNQWTNFGPTTSTITSLDVVGKSQFPVVAFISGGEAHVMELSQDPISVSFTTPSVCPDELISIGPITYNDPNYDNSNAIVSISLPGGSPLSNPVVSGTYPDYMVNMDLAYTAAGTYSFDVNYDNNTGDGSGSDNTFNIDVLAAPNIQFSFPDNEICDNHNPLLLNNFVSPSGGTWSISGGGNLPLGIFNPAAYAPGNYTLTYTRGNPSTGCISSKEFNFTVNGAATVSVSTTTSSCGEDDGTATATVTTNPSGGDYDIYWSNGDTTNLADTLAPGMYFVNVYTAEGCLTMDQVAIENDDINLSGVVTNATCYGGDNGSIDLTITGAGGPYNIYWSNGDSDEDPTDLIAGPYNVTVTDQNGCSASQVFNVGQASEITWTAGDNAPSCNSTDGLAYCQTSGGTAPYSWQWFNSNNNPVGSNNDTLDNISGGYYYVIITDANGCTATWNTVVNEAGGPTVTIDSVMAAGCANEGAIYTTIDAPSGILDIGWNNGDVTEDITGLNPGYYAIWVQDNSGCIGMASTTIDAILPDPVEVCLVTVDTLTTTNKVVWEKPISTSISHFNVYRETSQAGLFQIVDSVLYSEDSEFTDPIASPIIRSWRYKLSSVDLCGNESELSDDHKTIHLTISQGLGGNINLHWDHYEGFNYATYEVWRHDNVNGWVNIQNLANSSTSYTDFPSVTDELDYMVVITPPGTCSSTKANDYNSSRSNRSAGVFVPGGGEIGIDENNAITVDLFPNPSNGKFKLILENNDKKDIQVITTNGAVVYQLTSFENEVDFDLSGVEPGIYVLVIQNGKEKTTKKLIIK